MKKIPDIINRLWNVCGQMEVGALLTWGSGIILVKCPLPTDKSPLLTDKSPLLTDKSPLFFRKHRLRS